MTSGAWLCVTVLVVACGVAVAGPGRYGRQAANIASSSDPNQLICLLFGNCTAQPQLPVPPTATCSCVKMSECQDLTDPSGDGGLLQFVNLRISQVQCSDDTDVCCNSVVSPSPCRCVKFWQCQDNNLIVGSDPSGDGSLLTLVNLRIQEVQCSDDPQDICCNSVDPEMPPTARILEESTALTCGRRNQFGVHAHFQGFGEGQAQYGEYPWMAAVITSDIAEVAGAHVYVCGGSLIHPRVVLTVAHYVHQETPGKLLVRLGEWNFKAESEPESHQDIPVQQIIVHPNFNLKNVQNNTALLVLERDATLGATVGTICLPQPFQKFDGSKCFTSGWGKDSFGKGGRFQEILKSLELPVLNQQSCTNALRSSTRLPSTFNLDDSSMCAGGEAGIDSCTGDGGSPLACPDPNNPKVFVQAGIVSWGLGCGQEGLPGVYSDVGYAVKWIEQNLPGNFDVRSPL